jgi:hypothetical protein
MAQLIDRGHIYIAAAAALPRQTRASRDLHQGRARARGFPSCGGRWNHAS